MTSIDEILSSDNREALVEMVKLAQRREMKGSNGGWKEFLKFYDKKTGDRVSDPSRRTIDDLIAFLKTFTMADDVKLFEKILHCHSNREASQKIQKTNPVTEPPEQKLVRLTLEHLLYPVDYSFPSHEEGWMVIKGRKKFKATRPTKMVAVDCEMVLCEDGTEALVRVCVVDRDLKIKLNEFIKPKKAVIDYRTEITGITEKDLEGVACSLEDVQISMKKILSHGTILIGHGLNNDLRALKIDHSTVIDTSFIFKYGNGSSGRRPSLYNLCKLVLGFELRNKGAAHSCVDDACAAMKLVLAKIERGVENDLPLAPKDAKDVDTARLLVHRIPSKVQTEDLHEVIPGDFTVEVKATRKAQGKYSAFAIFKSQEEANNAFELLEGNVDKDLYGRSEKTVSFQLKSGTRGTLSVCEKTPDSASDMSKKRPMLHEEAFDEKSKKPKMSQEEEKTAPFDNKSKKPKMSQVEEKTAPTEETKAEAFDKKSKKPKMSQEEEKTALTEETMSEVVPDLREVLFIEIKRLRQELSQKNKEITSLNKIIVALTRKQGL